MTTKIIQIPGWATGGTKTAPGAGLSSTGYVKGTQPAAGNWNYLEDEDRQKANELIDATNDLNDTVGNGFAEGTNKSALMTKLYESTGFRTLNAYDADNLAWGDADIVVDMAVHEQTTGAVKIMALIADDGAPRVDIFDAEAKEAPGSAESTSGDLSGDLPTGSSQTWQATSFCTDGTSVFVIFQDTNLNPNETHQIQAWDIDGWTVKSGWPSTGTLLPGTGTALISGYDSAVEVVSATRLATANTWYGTITANTDPAITIINLTTGAIVASGAGDHPLSLASANRITSDGANVYFTLWSSTHVCSAQIASPSTGSTNPDMPYNPATHVGDVCCVGHTIVTTSTDSAVLAYHHNTLGHQGDATAASSNIFRRAGTIAFDGIAFWMIGSVIRSGGSKMVVYRIDPGINFGLTVSTTPGGFPDISESIRTTMALPTTVGYGEVKQFAPMVFDGKNIWVAMDQASASAVYRIPKAVLR